MLTEKLVKDKKLCCGCGGCVAACPKKAIQLMPDENGFMYPEINREACINCGMCQRVCAFQHFSENEYQSEEPSDIYAAVTKNDDDLKKASSGGMFPLFAKHILQQGGVVYGAAYDRVTENELRVRHIEVTEEGCLPLLQGSKYVQSDSADIFPLVVKRLKEGKTVLFTGTPCQVAEAIRYCETFAKKQAEENLYTMEVLCHGVPSLQIMNDYIKYMKERGTDILFINFRDKERGWSANGSFTLAGNIKKHYFDSNTSYVRLFKGANLNRKSCYNCPYAQPNRHADITVGDFWGVETTEPGFALEGEKAKKGISILMCSTTKGKQLFEACHKDMDYIPTTFEKAAYDNEQLKHPASPTHPEILENYESGNWEKTEKQFKKIFGLKRYTGYIALLLSPDLKARVKRAIKRK